MRFFVHFKREFKQTSISFISLERSCKGEQFGVYLDFKGLNAFEILNRKVYKGRGDRPFESKMVHLVKKILSRYKFKSGACFKYYWKGKDLIIY